MPEHIAIARLVVCVPTVILWILAIWLWWKDRKIRAAERQASTWPTVGGFVVSSDVEEAEWKYWLSALLSFIMMFIRPLSVLAGDSEYLARVEYRYAVGGKNYVGNKIRFVQKKFSTRGDAEKIIKQYPPGSEVTVHYAPLDPGVSVLNTTGSDRGALYGVIFFSVVMTVNLAIFEYIF